MNDLYVSHFDFVKKTTEQVENIDIEPSMLDEWLVNFADDFWGFNAISSIDLPDDRDELIIYADDDTFVASITYSSFISSNVFSGAKIIRKYALLRKNSKEVHYSEERKYFFFDTYEDALAELKENTDIYSKKILFFNISDRYGKEIVKVDDNFYF